MVRTLSSLFFFFLSSFLFSLLTTAPPWARSTKNPDAKTGPLARPFTHSLAPLTLLTPSLVGKWMIRWLFILCFVLFWTILLWLLLFILRFLLLLLFPFLLGLSTWFGENCFGKKKSCTLVWGRFSGLAPKPTQIEDRVRAGGCWWWLWWWWWWWW